MSAAAVPATSPKPKTRFAAWKRRENPVGWLFPVSARVGVIGLFVVSAGGGLHNGGTDSGLVTGPACIGREDCRDPVPDDVFRQ